MTSKQPIASGSQDRGSFQHIAVVGIGLIGGSLVKSLRRALPHCKLIGVDFPEVMALARDWLDEAYPLDELERGLSQADLVFLATPITVILQQLPIVANFIRPGAVVTDVGSTKHLIVAQAQKYFTGARYFIGGHPMAGREKGGWENADPYLFENAIYVLTPLPNSSPLLLNSLKGLLQAIGAQVITLAPEEHDRIAAEVSHLPQLLAIALTNFMMREGVESASRLQLAAGGFRDMTRIAASPFSLWRDILSSNPVNLRKSLQEFTATLQSLADQLEDDGLEKSFQRANQWRQLIPRDTRGFLQPHFDLTVTAPDRPGEIARIAAALAAENINIKDIEVLKVREGEGGTLRLAFDSEAARALAEQTLEQIGYHSGR